MNQPPDDDFYNSSTENTKFQSQQRPGYSQQPQSAPGNYPQQNFPQPGPGQQNFPQPGPGQQNFPQPGPGQQNFPQQRPMGQPGVGPGPQGQLGFGQQRGPGFPQPQSQGPISQPGFGPPNGPPRPASQPGFPQPQSQGPVSQPGFGPPNAPPRPANQPGLPQPQSQGPVSQPGFGPPNAPPRPANQPGPGPQRLAERGSFEQPGSRQQRGPGFPPPSGPISQPGFSFAAPTQQDRYAPQEPPWPGNNPQSGSFMPPKELPGAFAPQPPPGASTDWPDPAQARTPARSKKSRPWLIIILVLLVIVVIGGGTFELFVRKGSNPVGILTTQGTSTTNGVTPTVTKPASTPTAGSAFHSISTPVQAGTDWIATITSIKETTSSLIAPNAGSTYLEVNLTLKNISGNSLTLVSLIEFALVDASGHRYNETAADTNIRRPADGTVNSDQTLVAQIAYEVPTNQHTFTLTFAYGLSHNSGASIAWQFTV